MLADEAIGHTRVLGLLAFGISWSWDKVQIKGGRR